jgi:hypothetical protein
MHHALDIVIANLKTQAAGTGMYHHGYLSEVKPEFITDISVIKLINNLDFQEMIA